MAWLGIVIAPTLVGLCACDKPSPFRRVDVALDESGIDDDNSDPVTGSEDPSTPSDDPSQAPGTDVATLRLFNPATDQFDPRHATLPLQMPLPEMFPGATIAVDAPSATAVDFVVDGVAFVAVAAPFAFAPSTALPLTVGEHTIEAVVHAGNDIIDELGATFTISATGTDPTPDSGAHTAHTRWLTDTDVIVHTNGDGDFVDDNAGVVVAHDAVTAIDVGGGDVRLQTSSGPRLVFSFSVLLPDGFDDSVAYPLLTVLHHGSENYRGTDADPVLLEVEPLRLPLSPTRSAVRHQVPAIVFLPQLPMHDAVDGVNNEWAAFTAIDAAGNTSSAANPSVGGALALAMIERLVAGSLVIDGVVPRVDAARLYLTGHSMGGLGTWDWVEREPDRFAAAAPMAGYPDFSAAGALVDTPLWAFHHRSDCYNTFAGTEHMVELIEAAGGTRVRLSALDFDTGGACDQAHFQTPTVAFADEALWPWMFAQLNDRL